MSLSAACGGDDEPDPIPSPTESSDPGPEVSPAPDSPDLDSDQQAAFDTAVARFADYQEFGSRITANPTEPSLDEVTSELATFTVMPETKAWADSYDKLIDSGIRIEGARAVEWTVPVDVTEDKVVFDQCESPGTWTAIQGDEEITGEEARSLADLADALGLDDADRSGAHRAVPLALAHLAFDDGVIDRTERMELTTVCELLGLKPTILKKVLDQAEASRHTRLSADLLPLPDSWSLGEPLRVGQKVAFTGCDDSVRADLEARAEQLGVRVMNNISAKTAMLVTDGGFAGTKAAAAKKIGCRIIHPTDFTTMLKHLQPALTR